jgi:Hydrophobic surface binding protein A
MKYTVATLALAGSAMAAGAADTVNQVLTQIASDIKEFDSTIKAYAGDTTQLIAASKKIESDTSGGAQQISSGSELTLSDAVGITSNVQSLQTTLDSTLADLQGIGPQLASAGQCQTILDNLQSQAKAAQGLQDAITSKAPTETKAVAQQLGGAIGASIESTNAFFKKQCANAPSAPAGGAAGGHPAGGSSPKGSGAHDDMAGMPGMGGMGGGQSAGGAPSPASPGSPGSPASGGSGSKTNKASKTTGAAKPAQYTGAANTLTAPFLGALALAVFAL